ncbi:MAG: ligase-associated DNA damage response endonuclease PdeM [Phycisphaerae bacterium]|nr:ligase-associated DNA damage response endonuclease PdeM [Phycisphaerae bacterium]
MTGELHGAATFERNGERGRKPVSLSVAGEAITLLPERATWWPARSTLLVADLHLGKEETFLECGIPMPRAVLDETLARLGRLVASHCARRVVVVGDLVHARRGMTRDLVERVAAWRGTVDCVIELALGNHDRRVEIPGAWNVQVRVDDGADGPFVYRHEPPEGAAVPAPGEFTWCGHIHPTVRLGGGVDRLVLPCFVVGHHRAILPAFTAFSRGPSVPALVGDRVFAVAEGHVAEVRGA